MNPILTVLLNSIPFNGFVFMANTFRVMVNQLYFPPIRKAPIKQLYPIETASNRQTQRVSKLLCTSRSKAKNTGLKSTRPAEATNDWMNGTVSLN